MGNPATESFWVAMGDPNGGNGQCPSPAAVALYRLGGKISTVGGKAITYGAATIIVTSPAYLTPATAPIGAAGSTAGGLSVAAGEYLSTMGTGLQIGSAMWVGGQTGNWRPLFATTAPVLSGLVAPLKPLIGPTLEDNLQDYIEGQGAGINACGNN